MAIHPDFPGLEVNIIVDNKTAEEFEEPVFEGTGDDDDVVRVDDKIKVLERYVEAKPRVAFAIEVKIGPTFKYLQNDLYFHFDIDGVITAKRYSFRRDHVRGGNFQVRHIKIKSDRQIIQKDLIFGELETDCTHVHLASSAGKELVEEFQKLGKITCKVYRIIAFDEKPVTGDERNYDKDPSVGTGSIPEKALKKAHPGRSLSRRTELGPAVAKTPSSGTSFKKTYIDKEDEPFACFVFKYRSMEDLHKELIVPRPDDLESRPVSSLSVQEKDRLIEKMRADQVKQERLNARIAFLTQEKMKRRIAELEANSQRLKREPSEEDKITGPDGPSSFKKRKIITHIEQVDLTGDA